MGTRNAEINRATVRRWKQENPEKLKAQKRRYRARKTLRDRDAMLAHLGFTGTCQACGVEVEAPHIDHDHLSDCHPGIQRGDDRWCTSCARGAVCNACNVALGMVRDNPATLHALIQYLNARQGGRYG